MATLTLYGVQVVWDGVPLGGEVKALDEAQAAKMTDLGLIEHVALASLNLRRPATEQPYTLDDLRAMPLNGDTVSSLLELQAAVKAVMAGEKLGTTTKTARRPRQTGTASGPPSAATTAPR